MSSDNRYPEGPGERLLDLLLDALQERQATRRAEQSTENQTTPRESGLPNAQEASQSEGLPPVAPEAAAPQGETREYEAPVAAERGVSEQPSVADAEISLPREPGHEAADRPVATGSSAHLARTIRTLAAALVLLVAVINIPVNRYGTSLARIVPDTASLVLRDGLVLKAAGPDIYVLQDNKLRWISSLDAFEHFGYRWDQVHVVDEQFLQQFEMGRPLHILLKCQSSPHIYALENGLKRWIMDIPTFESEGYVWGDVKSVGCSYLRSLPDGPSIPEEAGPPPQP